MILFIPKKSNLGLRKVIVFGIMFFVLFFGFQSVLNLGKTTQTNLGKISLTQQIQKCEMGNCDVVNCDIEVKPDCTNEEIIKWKTLENYANKCKNQKDTCDALQNNFFKVKSEGNSINNQISKNYKTHQIGAASQSTFFGNIGNGITNMFSSEKSSLTKKILKENPSIIDKFGIFKVHGKINPKRIILHHTGGNSVLGAENAMKNHKDNLGVHFIIDKDGIIYMYGNLDDKFYHAGPANADSVGIEIVNTGNQEYPVAQYKGIKKLLEILNNNIPNKKDPFVIGHFEVRKFYGSGTKGKWDPSPNFNWDNIGYPRDKTLLAKHCKTSTDFSGICFSPTSNIG